MINLQQIRLREIRLPLREPFRISSGVVSTRRILLLELTDASGVTVWSECVAGESPNYTPETIDTAWIAISQWVAPRVIGVEHEHPGDVHVALDKDFRGHNMAKAGVEMGMWAVAATQAGLPLSRFIGGTRASIATGISLGIQRSPAALVEKARAAVAEGYRKVKIKIMPGSDVEFVRAAREELGASAPLMADANNAYTIDDIGALIALDSLDLMMIEQPLAWDDIVRHAELQKQLETPVCLDESITSLDRAVDMHTLGSGRIINIKPGRVGGFGPSIAIHDFCEQHGIPVWCGGMFESGVGRSYNVALASLPNFTKPGDVSPSARYWERDVVTPEWTMDSTGMVKVPLEQPGIGVDIDIDRIDNLTVRSEVVGKD
jgi:O-succinylbenzoate synthase